MSLALLSEFFISSKKSQMNFGVFFFIDGKNAHVNARFLKEVYAVLPDEAGEVEGKCGKLIYCLYGCREAAQAWEENYSNWLEDKGFARGLGSGAVYYHVGRDIH